MAMTSITYHQVRLEDIEPFQKKIADARKYTLDALGKDAVREEYGNIEYLIAFNREGGIYLFLRNDNHAEEGELRDEAWSKVNDALVVEAKDNYIQFRIKICASENIVEHIIDHRGICYPLLTQCPGGYKLTMPVKYRSILENIDAALANKPSLAAERLTEVETLRKKGESLHNEQKYAESLKALEQAKVILGIV